MSHILCIPVHFCIALIDIGSVHLFRKRKLEEVAKHEKLPKHPNCVRFVKAWEEKCHLYIQTELCQAR